MSVISATTWVPRGYASEYPIKYEFNDEELEHLSGMAKLQIKSTEEEMEDEEGEEEAEEKKEKIKSLKRDAEDEE